MRKEGGEAFQKRAAKATSLPDFLFRKLSDETDLTRLDGRARLVELAKPLLGKIPEGPLRELMNQQLREKSGVQSLGGDSGLSTRRVSRNNRSTTQRLSPMATAISLLLQQPELACQRSLPENLGMHPEVRGFSLLERLFGIALKQPDITTGVIIERFRDTEEGSTLEKLAAKDHLLEQDDFLPFFTETINTLEDQAIGQSIENLVSRASQEELDEASKTELSALYAKRQHLRQQCSES